MTSINVGLFRRLAPLAAAMVLLCSFVPAARAQTSQKEKAKQLDREARTDYDLGRWDKAIEVWKRAYEEYPAASALFNIGQAYRQKGDCKNASFFYKRFLDRRPDAPNAAEVKGFIAELDETCDRTEKVAEKPPTAAMSPDDGGSGGNHGGGTEQVTSSPGSGTGAAVETSPEDGSAVTGGIEDGTGSQAPAASVTASPRRASVLTTIAQVGPSFLSLGDLEVPVQFSARFGAGYPIQAGPLVVDAGAAVTFTPVPWKRVDASGTAMLTGVLGNVGGSYPITEALSVRGEVGLGALIFSGVSEASSVFIAPGQQATAALTMFHVRVGLGAEYALPGGFVANLSPVVFAYSPAKAGMREDIDSVSRFELLAGIGYRL
jgi:hypothetical protein